MPKSLYINSTYCNYRCYSLIIRLTQHAKNQMIIRGFSKKEIEEAIIKGIKIKQDNKIISVFRDYKVVFKKVEDIYYVITIMYK